DGYGAKDLWNTCKLYGHVVDVFIPDRRTKGGKRFGFLRFIKVLDIDRLIHNLCMVWVGRNKIHTNVARFQRGPLHKQSNKVNNKETNNVNHGAKGMTNSYAHMVKGNQVQNVGKVKEFASLTNLKVVLGKEGYANIELKYMGDEMVIWVKVEGVSYKWWSRNTFSRIASRWGTLLNGEELEEEGYHINRICIRTKLKTIVFDSFKMVYRGMTCRVRTIEVPGWVPDFEEDDVEGESDREEVPETNFEEVPDKSIFEGKFVRQNDVHSEDPFGIYEVLNKKWDGKNIDDKHEDSLKYPPGFTPNEEGDVPVEKVDNCQRSKEDDIQKIFTSVFVTNFPDGYGAKDLWKVKEFASLTNLKVVLGKEGYVNIELKYMGDERVIWVKVEGVPYRFLSDHRPIIMREAHYDYGPIPFKFFHYWFELDGFDKLVEQTWLEANVNDQNSYSKFMNKLKYLKEKIRIYTRLHKESLNSRKSILKAELADLDGVIDKGDGSDDDGHRRREVIRLIQEVEKVDAMKVAQKAKIKWFIEGDENSKYYHGVLNKMRGRLTIRGVLVDGIWMESPHLVKHEFFEHFKNRFEKPNKSCILLERDFVKRISLEQNDDLEREVSNEEIKRAVWDCGIDKAPGPDGFTFGFYRWYWDIIGNDVVDAFKWFFFAWRDPERRHISLIGSFYKVIAKVLANRLVTVLDDIVDEIQSAFVTDRPILDGPLILNEIVHWCKNKKKQSMIFRVDFKKAYDSVRCDFIDDILRRFGFGDKWCKWSQSCLYSSRGSVLVNGSPTKEFQFHKGLKQGDPLSPFLFILVLETLHVSFQRVVDASLLNGIKLDSSLQISHLFYADDAIFMGQWSQCNIDTIIRVLDVFYRASGLRINMNKSNLMGISVDSIKVKHAAVKIGISLEDSNVNILPRVTVTRKAASEKVMTGPSDGDIIVSSFIVGSGDFSVSSVRKLIDNAKTRWIKDVPIKINVHAWKMIHDCLPTRFNISQRGEYVVALTGPRLNALGMVGCGLITHFVPSKLLQQVPMKGQMHLLSTPPGTTSAGTIAVNQYL
nr:putative RNA-directed DNA polymerase, eukaryota, reverse transcriptase zinc-binding domain protein [Tanacetum cinerariifolium]